MNSTPFIPSLDPKQVKTLLRELRVLRLDYPRLSDAELADEWAERQALLAEQGRPCPFADWLEGDAWRAGFGKALGFANRQIELKQRNRVRRRAYKEAWLDRQPSTPRQQRYVKRLAEKYKLELPVPAEQLSKLRASKLIQQFLGTPGGI